MRILYLATLALSLLLFACGEKDATAFDPAGQKWTFSLNNPVPVMKNSTVPSGTPISGQLGKGVFEPGDVLVVQGDSIVVESAYKTYFTGFAKKYLLLSEKVVSDTQVGFRLSQGVGTTLNAALYKGDSLMGEWLFEPQQEGFKEIAFGELSGQTFECVLPEGDTVQVHFGVSILAYGRNEGEKYEYYVEELPGFRKEESLVKGDDIHHWGARMIGVRDRGVYFAPKTGTFSSEHHLFGRDEDGTVIASYIEVNSGSYEKVNIPLNLLPPIKAGISEADFADRINSGTVLADDTYPRVDSADVSYRYQKDYKGIEFDELSELEFSAEPGGEFIVVVRDRLLWNSKWRLSPDGRYLITLNKKGLENRHYPILAYTDDYIDLRMPFTVKTREPRGVALESFTEINVFVRIVPREGATSY